MRFFYGQRVKVHHKGVWWEGVVLDQEEGSQERVVLLLDSGCGITTTTGNLQPSTAPDPVDWSFLIDLLSRGDNHASKTHNVAAPVEVGASPVGDSCVVDDHDQPEKRIVVSGDMIYNDSGGGSKPRRGKVGDDWVVAGPELVPGAKHCPRAIDELVSFGTKRPPESLVTDARQHLRYLGWKIEVSPYQRNQTSFRYRYSPPDTGKAYFSLKALCVDLTKTGNGDCSLVPVGKRMRESEEDLSTPVEKAADVCQNPRTGKKLRTGGIVGGHQLPRVLRSNVSCKELLAEPREESREQSTKPHCENWIEISDDEKESTRPFPLKRNPRSVLSWLIDNNVVSEGDKVRYRVVKPHNQCVSGRITREGIDCDCCRMVFGLTAFEAHAGSTNRRPAANILLEDDRTLMDCTKEATKSGNKGQGISKTPAVRVRFCVINARRRSICPVWAYKIFQLGRGSASLAAVICAANSNSNKIFNLRMLKCTVVTNARGIITPAAWKTAVLNWNKMVKREIIFAVSDVKICT